MVGIFSRFSASRTRHRRTQSALDEREVLPSSAEVTVAAAASHGIEVVLEFKPVEHPTEPLDNDQPVNCPVPEPSILNDGRLWRERMPANVRRGELAVMKEGDSIKSEASGTNPQPSQFNRSILPSVSAPEHNIINMLEEYNASGI
ncbi:hypothetical protein HHK36_000588 [Tetracentron sinense]|uniref:Cystic fibrosis transmembrane conductance regulator n=1 Tax=Tetracentron sinense TaxID=13715 RepID=A0A834ZRB1_TETSI|nr:hypothetical protein HHK36_000588 [Tetracentron sinense]